MSDAGGVFLQQIYIRIGLSVCLNLVAHLSKHSCRHEMLINEKVAATCNAELIAVSDHYTYN
jgi:hypothetical protein